jgi:hypothetical protein
MNESHADAKQPYVSFVVSARNDNYGGDFLRRIQLFVSTLAKLCERHRLAAELLVVEWNPPADRPPLREAVEWPGNGLTIRIVTVPPSFHRGIANSDKMPMFEYFGKNVGIRRARGDYVLITNPDIIFSDEMIAYLAKQTLRHDCYTKADRYDVAKGIPTDLAVDDVLRLCRQSVVNVWTGYGAVNPSWRARLAHFALLVRKFVARPHFGKLVQRIWRATSRPARAWLKMPDPKPDVMHTGPGGDFMLMARRQWLELHGYPELPTNSQIDTFMVCLASAAGLKELVLPYRIYHQEHDRSAHAKREFIALHDLPGFLETRETHKPVNINGGDWGLRGIELPEWTTTGVH